MKKLRVSHLLGLLCAFFGACSYSSDAFLEQAKTLMQAGKHREALEFLNKAVSSNDQNSECFNARGVAYFELKEYDNALLDYAQAIKLDPAFYRPYYNRALLRVAQNDAQNALKDYAEAIRRAPNNAEIWVNRGQLLATTGQNAPALLDFEAAVKLDPKNALAWYNRGNVLFKQENLKQAAESFQQAVANDPKFGKAYYALGLAQLAQRNQDLGCLNLKQAAKIGYNDAQIAVEQYCK